MYSRSHSNKVNRRSVRRYCVSILLASGALANASPAAGQTLNLQGYFYETVATGLSFPTMMAFVDHNDFLVLEKNTGKVKRYVNGVFVGEVLDLAVSNQSERGLLGIVSHPDFPQVPKFYVYYSRATVDGGTWLDNRVETFTWNGTTLVVDQLIADWPPDPTQNNGPNHDGGYMVIGPDRKLYIQTGDLNRGRFNNPRIEQNTSSTAVAGVGAIERRELDGSAPPDNPFFSHSDPRVRNYYCYGFRNGYGMAFDPVTDILWMTENGSGSYDEINYCLPGLNSGWVKIMGPDKRDASYAENGFQVFDAEDLFYLPGSHYRDPEFSWLAPVGVTALEFLRSRKFYPSERNAMFVGDINGGRLFYFQLTPSRDELELFGGTLDKVADTLEERNQHVVGTGFAGITDIKIGPDGYAYIVSYFNGAVYRIRPIVETVYATSLQMLTGVIQSGGLAELEESDDLKFIVREAPPIALGGPSVAFFIEGTSPEASPVEVSFVAEFSTSAAPAPATTFRTSLFNFQTNSYEIIDSRAGTATDVSFEVSITKNPSRFVDPTSRTIRARFQVLDPGTLFTFGWAARFDTAVWKVTVR